MSNRLPVRVVHLLGSARPGGIETFVLSLARFLDPARVELSVCIEDDDGPIAAELRTLDVPVRLLGRGPRITRITRLYRSLRAMKCEVLHANSGGRAVGMAARLAVSSRLIFHLHGPPRDVRQGDAKATHYLRRSAAAARCILVSSDAMLNWIAQADPELRARTRRVYYGIDADQFAAAGVLEGAAQLRAALGVADHERVVGFVGRLVPQKGIGHLAAIARALMTERPELHFVIVGDGPLRPLVYELQAEFPLRCHSLGTRRDITVIMSAMDVLVVPSEWEPLGIVSIEAMLAAKPVVAFDVDGISEVVEDGRTGLLAPPGDVNQCVAHLTRLLGDAQLRKAMGQAGRSRARRLFDARAMSRTLEEIYLQVSW